MIKKTYLFIGTTAELIKLAPVIRELNKRRIIFTVIATGQNDIHFEEFKSILGKTKIIYAVTPKSQGSSILKFILWTTRTFVSLLIGMRLEFRGLNSSNSYFIVHGDTVSSLMGALVATIYGLKLVHIESGLRSFNFLEPFPEEVCRVIVSKLARIHFCPNKWSVTNLESVVGEKINTQQNTLFDTFRLVIKKKSNNTFVKQMQKTKKMYFVLVIHRQEHVIFGKEKTNSILKFILNNAPRNLRCVFLVHDLSVSFIRALEPVISHEAVRNLIKARRLPYRDFMHLLKNAEFIITDGGSNQEETYYMGKPCLLVRNYTERIEGLGENVVLSRENEKKIVDFFKNYGQYQRKPLTQSISPSKIIVDYLIAR